MDHKADLYNQPYFIKGDPIMVPHRYTLKQDIEISGFFAATLAWGNRTTIIANALRLMQWMDDSPYDFIVHHQETDLKKMLGFVHRTFNATDLLYFIHFLKYHYSRRPSLESAFLPDDSPYAEPTIEQALRHFHNYFFSIPHPARTHKHVATPARRSACKRLCMFLRWMVRHDEQNVDFGLWSQIGMTQLVCPLDVHVARVAHRLGILPTPVANWPAALELTSVLRALDPADPVRYDFALFGLGMAERLR